MRVGGLRGGQQVLQPAHVVPADGHGGAEAVWGREGRVRVKSRWRRARVRVLGRFVR